VQYVTVAGIKLHEYVITTRPADATLYSDLSLFIVRRPIWIC